MKLGIIGGWDEPGFSYVKNKGLDCVEFCVNHNHNAAQFLADAGEVRQLSEKYGIPVASMGRWGMERIDENGQVIEQALNADLALIEAAGIIGCPVYNVGVNYTENLSFYENCQIAISYLKKLIAFGKEKGVKIATYNCDWSNFIYDDRAWSVIHTALNDLGIKYDASHCINRDGDYLKELSKWANRVYHVHIKGNLRIGNDTYDDAPAGLDNVCWGGIFDILYSVDYNGALSIEPHSSYWKGAKGQWGVDFTIGFIRKFIMPEDYAEKNEIYMP